MNFITNNLRNLCQYYGPNNNRTFVNLSCYSKFMKMRTNVIIASVFFLLASCISIPKETITLSQTLGNDLIVLHNAHRNITLIHFKKIKDDINSFVDQTYAPFVIQHVLASELQAYQSGKPSLYATIEHAGETGGTQESEMAVKEMFDFQSAAYRQIERKRNELLTPVINQETEVITAVNRSYEHAIYANSTITGYLQSIRKVKEAQQEALSKLGLSGSDTLFSNTLIEISEQIAEAVKKGKEIDIHSTNAGQQLNEISDQIKEIIRKK